MLFLTGLEPMAAHNGGYARGYYEFFA